MTTPDTADDPTAELRDAINALTEAEKTIALMFLVGYTPEGTGHAVLYASDPRAYIDSL